ncbi:MAG: CAP domain-containing protein [Anaerolineales bacterium]
MRVKLLLITILGLCTACAGRAAEGPAYRLSSRAEGTQLVQTNQANLDTDLTSAITTAADSILAAVNLQRALAGIPPLIQQPALVDAAYTRSTDMAVRRYLGHVDPADGSQAAEELLHANGFQGRAAELLFQTERPVSEVSQAAVDAWLQDSDHSLILLSPEFRYAGIGVMGNGERWTVTMLVVGESPQEGQ